MEGLRTGDRVQLQRGRRSREITGAALGTAGGAESFATQASAFPAEGWVTVPREGLALPSPPARPGLTASRRDPRTQHHLAGSPGKPHQAPPQGEDEQ